MPPLDLTLAALVVSALALWRAHAALDDRFLEEWAGAHGLELTFRSRPLVVWHLRTARVLRAWGAVAGVFLPTLVELAWSGRGRILGVSGEGMQPGDVGFIFIGYLVGALYAEVALVRPVNRDRTAASLVPRELGNYLPARLLWAQRCAGAAVVVLAVAVGAASFEGAFREPSWASVAPVVAFFVAFTLGIERLQRWVVRRPQPFTEASLVAADDALKAQAVHSLAGGGLAVLLFSCSGIASVLAASGGSVVAWAMGLLAVPPLILALVSCQHVGSRPWRVRRPVAGRMGGQIGGAPA